MNDSLDTLLRLGEQMHLLLADDDMQAFDELVRRRARLIDRLSPLLEERRMTGESAEKIARANEQYARIMDALLRKEQRLLQELQSLHDLKRAKQSYRSGYQPRQILHKYVSG